MRHLTITAALLTAVTLGSARLVAQAPPSLYGPSVTADQAKAAGAAAVAEARKNQWMMAIAVVDTAGELVYFEKMDQTQSGSVDVAISKARSSARFRRPTKVFQDAVAAGGEGLRFLGLEGAVPVEGGLPLVVGGRIVGAIGASGGTSQQDAVAAAAGVATLK